MAALRNSSRERIGLVILSAVCFGCIALGYCSRSTTRIKVSEKIENGAVDGVKMNSDIIEQGKSEKIKSRQGGAEKIKSNQKRRGKRNNSSGSSPVAPKNAERDFLNEGVEE